LRASERNDWTAWISERQLAADANLARSSVQRAVRQLQELGEIKQVGTVGRGCPRYRIMLPIGDGDDPNRTDAEANRSEDRAAPSDLTKARSVAGPGFATTGPALTPSGPILDATGLTSGPETKEPKTESERRTEHLLFLKREIEDGADALRELSQLRADARQPTSRRLAEHGLRKVRGELARAIEHAAATAASTPRVAQNKGGDAA
jgi:hypothetical protein